MRGNSNHSPYGITPNSRPPLPHTYPRNILKDSLSESESLEKRPKNKPLPIRFRDPFSDDDSLNSEKDQEEDYDSSSEEKPQNDSEADE